MEQHDLLLECFRKVGNRSLILDKIDEVIGNHNPISLYIATKDRQDCLFIFDPQTTYYMLGGREVYDRAFEMLFTTFDDKKSGIILFILRKIGPFLLVKMSDKDLEEMWLDLKYGD